MFEIIKMTLAKTTGNTKAYFSFSYAGLIVTNATLYSNKDGGLSVGMPSQKGNDGKYYSTCYFRKEDYSRNAELLQVALEEYNKLAE